MSYWGSDVRNDLVGLTVERYELAADNETMTLYGVKDGNPATFILETEGDCCSHSWIESVIEESALIGHTITAVEDLDLPEDTTAGGTRDTSEEARDGELKFYGFAMTTTRGKCIIDFRNSSNGYYGGSISVRAA